MKSKITLSLAALVAGIVLGGCSAGDPSVNAAKPPEAPGLTPTSPQGAGGASNGATNGYSQNNPGIPGSSERR